MEIGKKWRKMKVKNVKKKEGIRKRELEGISNGQKKCRKRNVMKPN